MLCDIESSLTLTALFKPIFKNQKAKHQHLTALPHLHETLVSFCLSFYLCAIPAVLSTKVPKQHAFQGHGNVTTVLRAACACLSNAMKMEPSQTRMALRFGFWCLLAFRPFMFALCFLKGIYPFSVELVHSLLS